MLIMEVPDAAIVAFPSAVVSVPFVALPVFVAIPSTFKTAVPEVGAVYATVAVLPSPEFVQLAVLTESM